MSSQKQRKYKIEDLGELPNRVSTKSKSFIMQDTQGAVCAVCGEPFEQLLMTNPHTGTKYYSKFKQCPKHRSNLINAIDKVIYSEINYTPFEWQKVFHASTANVKLIQAASRAGKDTACGMEFIGQILHMLNQVTDPLIDKSTGEARYRKLTPNLRAWIIAPTFDLTDQLMQQMRDDLPRNVVVGYHKKERTIELINNGFINVKSADRPESLVGVGLDIVWVTEASRIGALENVWSNLYRRLADKQRGIKLDGFGSALINGSPRGKGYFYKMCQMGKRDSGIWQPRWETFHATAWDNPFEAAKRFQIEANGRTYEENLKLLFSKSFYDEDILGLFADSGNSVFPNFRETSVIEKLENEDGSLMSFEEMARFKEDLGTAKPFQRYVIGYDPAKTNDGSWCVVVEEDTGLVVEIITLDKMQFDEQIMVHIKNLSIKWNYARVNYGKTGLGEALEPFFMQAGLEYKPLNEQGLNKAKLVENLAIQARMGKFMVYNISDLSEKLVRQFEGYIEKKTANGSTFGNDSQTGHDDAVSASYFALADRIETEVIYLDSLKLNNHILFSGHTDNKKGSRVSFF